MDWDASSLRSRSGPIWDRRLVPSQRERQQLLCFVRLRIGIELFDSRSLYVR